MNLVKRFALNFFCLVVVLGSALPAFGQVATEDRSLTSTWFRYRTALMPVSPSGGTEMVSGATYNWTAEVENRAVFVAPLVYTASANVTFDSGNPTSIPPGATRTITGTLEMGGTSSTGWMKVLETKSSSYVRLNWSWGDLDPVVTPPPPPCERRKKRGKCGESKWVSVCPPVPEMQSFGSKLNFQIADSGNGSSCSSCGGSSVSGGGNDNLLEVFYKIIPTNPASLGNGPKYIYLNYDHRMEFHQNLGGVNLATLFDPVTEQVFYFEWDSVAQEYQCKIDIAGTIYDDNTSFKTIVLEDANGNTVTDPTSIDTQTVYAIVESADGWEYRSQLVDIRADPGDDVQPVSRLTKITSPTNHVVNFTYKYQPGDAALSGAPKKVLQIDKVTDGAGNEDTYTYFSTQQAGKWVVSDIDRVVANHSGNVNQSVRFTVDTSGRLSGVYATLSGTEVQVASYSYGSDTVWQASTIVMDENFGDVPQEQTAFISDDYVNVDNSLLNQFANYLQGLADGNGDRYAKVHRDNSTTGRFRFELNGRLAEWRAGDSLRYFESFTNNGTGFNGFTNLVEESSYPQYMNASGGTPTAYQAQMLQPAQVSDGTTGPVIEPTYDANGNTTRLDHADSTYELWQYNSKSEETYYRDRSGFVTLTERDSNGNIVRIVRGLKDVSGPGTETTVAGTVPIQEIRGYYGSGHANEGLLQWESTNAYVAGAIVAPAANTRTDYVYYSTNQLKEVLQPLAPGQSSRPKTTYTWNGDRLASKIVTRPSGAETTSYQYDTRGRLKETLYPDSTTEQTFYSTDSLTVYKKNRANVVEKTVRDAAGRVTSRIEAFAYDTNLHDGNTGSGTFDTLHNEQIASPTTYTYDPGETQAHTIVTNGKTTEQDFDYKGRLIETVQMVGHRGSTELAQATQSSYVDNQLFSRSQMFGSINGSGDFVADYTRRTYYAYSATGLTVRTIDTALSTTTFADNTAILAAARVQGPDRSYIVNDAIRDLRGNIVELINPKDTSTFTTYDGLNRAVSRTEGYGTALALTTSTEYDVQSNVTKTTSPSGAETTRSYDASGSYLTGQTIAANDAQLSATTSFTYDSSGREKTVVAPGANGLPDANRTTETFYDTSCCGQTIGTKNALGHGQIQSNDALGRNVHSVAVEDYASHTSLLNPLDAKTLSETTTRYFDNGQVQYRTLWKVALDENVNRNLPQIAGLSKPIANGVTTQFAYDLQVGDGLGLETTSGITISSLTTSTTKSISIAAAVTKLAETPVNGGAELSLSQHHGSATVAISPDEKVMQVSISDAAGRTVMNAIMSGPTATTPNQLLDWNCTQHDQVYALASFGDVEQVKQIDANGNAVSRLSDGYAWVVGSLDQDSNLTRTKFDTTGKPLEIINALSNSTTYVYDSLGRQTSMTTPAGTTSIAYDASTGRVSSQTDAKNNTTSFTYDLLDRPTITTDRLSKQTKRGYNRCCGQLAWIEDAEGKRTDYTYDVIGQRLTTELHDNSVTTVTYDAVGRRASVTKHSGVKQEFIYQALTGLLTEIKRYDATLTFVGSDTFTFDAYMRPTGSSSIDGVTTARTYTDRGQVASDSMTYQGQSYPVNLAYGSRGRLQDVTYPSGRKAEYTYTNKSQIETIKWDSVQLEDRVYDSLGRLTENWRAYTDEVRTYDAANRLTSIDNNHGAGKVSYTYDANSNKLSETWDAISNMSAWNFTTQDGSNDGYDAEDRFTRFKRTGQSEDILLPRTDIGNISNVKVNAVDNLRSYSDAHELTSIAGVAQTFDADGNMTLDQTGKTLDWSEAGRLEKVSTPAVAPNTSSQEATYGYDASGKRSWKQVKVDVGTLHKGVAAQDGATGTAYVMYSEESIHTRLQPHSTQADHLVAVRYTGTVWQYDRNTSWAAFTPRDSDRLLAVIDHGDSTPGMVSVTPITTLGVHAGGIKEGYVSTNLVFTANFWDGQANLGEVGVTGSWFTAEHTVYVHSGPNCIAEYTAGEAASSPNQEYVYADQIDSLVLIDTGSEELTVLRNQQWSVTALVDRTNGNTKERYAYDVFGQRTILAPDGSTIRTESSYNNPYGYTSRRHDAETGYCYFRERYYDPSTGEFTSRDLMEYVDGMTLYRGYFVPGKTDPTGGQSINTGEKDAQGRVIRKLVKAEARHPGVSIPGDPLSVGDCFVWDSVEKRRVKVDCPAGTENGATSSPGILDAIRCSGLQAIDLAGGLSLGDGIGGEWPLGMIGPVFVTGEWKLAGKISTCKKKNGSIGAMICGSISASINGKLGWDANGTRYEGGSNGGVMVSKNHTTASGRTHSNEGCRLRKYIPNKEHFGTKRNCGTIDQSTLPPCKDDLDLKFSLYASASGSAGYGTLSGTYKIGECSISNGCSWQNEWSTNFSHGFNTPHFSIKVTGKGTGSGCIVLGAN